MSRFSHYNQDVSPTRRARFEFDEVHSGGDYVWLDVVIADESNSGYHNGVLQFLKHQRQVTRSRAFSSQFGKKQRDNDRALFAKHVVKRWGNVFDEDGKAVTFSKDACKEFLDALSDRHFDELREFCRDPYAFRDNEEDEGDDGGEAQGKG